MFPKDQTQAIKQAMCGFFTQLKVGIANGFNRVAKKFTKGGNGKEGGIDKGNEKESGVNDVEVK